MANVIQSVMTTAGELQETAEALKEHFETPFTEAMERDMTLLNFFRQRPMTGHSVQWKIHYEGNTNVAPYAEGADWGDADIQKYKEAEVPVTHNAAVVQVTGTAIAATRNSDAAYFQLLAENMEESTEDLKNEINNQLLGISTAGAAADRIGADDDASDHGFAALLQEANVYAGIDRNVAANDFWIPYISDNSGTPRPVTIALMQNITETMFEPDRFGANLSVILCAKKHQNQYGNLLTAYRRFTGGGTLDYGVDALEFEGIPVVAVPALPAGNMYFLDESEWGYYVLENFTVEPVATGGDTVKFAIKHYSQIVCKHPGKQAVLADLS